VVVSSPIPEVPFTELIQHPTRTTGRLRGSRALRLRRRDADDLVLMEAARAEQEGEVIDLTAKLLRGVLREEGGLNLFRHVLPTVVPWMRFLPAAAVEEMVGELADTILAAAAVNNLAPISQLLVEWQHTAEIYADPELYAILTAAHEGDHGPVPEPIA